MSKQPTEKTPPLVERTSVPIGQVNPNAWNPNVQEADIFRLLAQSMTEEGFGEPVLVRRVPDKKKPYEIVNGEHRYRLAIETGMTHLPVAIVDMDQTNAMLATLRRNKTRGGLDTIRTAKILADMRKRLSEEEITQRLGFSTDEQRELLAMLDAPYVPAAGGGGFAPLLTFELEVPEKLAEWLDASLIGMAGKRERRFEGRSSRKRRGLAKAVELNDGQAAPA